jgi:hypothetical protein
MSKALWYIYALKDPRNGAVCYVGTTVDLARKHRTHSTIGADGAFETKTLAP